MPGRTYSSEGYSWGFNGKEKDDEVSDQGNCYDYGFRIYNSRLGKFLSVDPLSKSYPWYTPYQFTGNKPIWAIDLDGLEEVCFLVKYAQAYRNFFRLITSNTELKNDLWIPISKDEKRKTHKIYFTFGSSKSLTYLSGGLDASETRGLTLASSKDVNLGMKAYAIYEYMKRLQDNNPRNDGMSDEAKQELSRSYFVLKDLGFDDKEISKLALDYINNRSSYFVVLNYDHFDLNNLNKNVFRKIAKTAGHEIKLHLINKLLNRGLTPEEEHEEGFGKKSRFTPEDKDIPPNSILGKLHKKIDKALEKFEVK